MKKNLVFPNGATVSPTFSSQEMERRIATLRKKMGENNIEYALFTSIHNINYYSDFLYCSFGRPYGLLISHNNMISISAFIDGGQPYRRTFQHNNVIYTDWQKDNFFYTVQQEVKNKTIIGIEYDHLTLERYKKLKQFLPEVQIVDIAAISMESRIIKSQEEIKHIEQGAQVCNVGGYAVKEAIGENIPEYEVALHSTQSMTREIAKRYPHAELMDTWTWFQSGINTDGAHNPVTSRKVQKGDILSLNCFSMIAGYYTALERTLFFDSIDKESQRIWEANCVVFEEGIRLIKPGIKCCEIAHRLNEIYKEYNLLEKRTFGYGHSFGVLSHYYGREAGLEIREDIETVLQPNMVISMEPMLTISEEEKGAGGYREHDILVVTEDGNRNITNFPYGPANNIIKK